MSLPPALDAARTAGLLDHGPHARSNGDRAAASPATAPARRVRGAARRVFASRAGRQGMDLTRRVLRRLLAEELAVGRTAVDDVQRLDARVGSLAAARLDEALVAGSVAANQVNLELLKAEVRSLQQTLNELGMAFAPATGLDGVAERFSELREQVNAVGRRLRQVEAGRPPTTGDAAPAAAPVRDAGPDTLPGLDELFDYVAFERRFRGDPEEILAVQQERYLSLLQDHAPVVDLGCGRGELAQLLASKGIAVIGVDTDAGMVAEARDRGLEVHATDAASYLRGCEPDSLGAVFSAHVAEHVPFDELLRIVHLSLEKLRPGGVFVAETPNPASLIVPSNSFILDPTHLRPIHPSLFAFVCETAGFRDVRLAFHAPATGYHLPRSGEGGVTADAVDVHADRLNEVLFGAQEYAVVATKATKAA